MKTYLVIYHMDVEASCEVEANSPEEAKAIAEHEDWSYDEEDVYETECHEIPKMDLFSPPDIEGVEVRRLK